MYGCSGRSKSSCGGRLLDDAAAVHHHDAVGGLGDHAEVVGDEQHRHPDLVAQVAEQREYLRLDRHVERGRGLVGDEQLRVARERHRGHHALAHAARHLVRVVLDALLRRRDADEREHLDGARVCGLAVELHVRADALGQLVLHGEDRVQAGHRLLEDHRDLVAANAAHLVWESFEQVLPAVEDLAVDHAPRRLEQAHHRERRDALARP